MDEPKLIDRGTLDFLAGHVDFAKMIGSDRTEPLALDIMEPLIATARLALDMLDERKGKEPVGWWFWKWVMELFWK